MSPLLTQSNPLHSRLLLPSQGSHLPKGAPYPSCKHNHPARFLYLLRQRSRNFGYQRLPEQCKKHHNLCSKQNHPTTIVLYKSSYRETWVSSVSVALLHKPPTHHLCNPLCKHGVHNQHNKCSNRNSLCQNLDP